MIKVLKRVLLAFLAVVAAGALAVFIQTNTGTNVLPNQNKKHAMLRLEDVGPGGNYRTLDDLGRLRAIFEYLESEQVPFHVAVIPRWKNLQPDGQWYEKGIDDPNPDDNVKKFLHLLQTANQHGGVLGMHGYTHQYGDSSRPDNNQNTGIGSEFNVKGAPETSTDQYAAEHITKSAAAFEKAGLQAGFWESPHYHDTRSQERIFRSFMGIVYQPDFYSLRSFKDLNMYDNENQYGRTTLGSVYIPAPLKYIHDKTSVEQVLAQLPDYHGLASMYYHPFLEFQFLEQVKDDAGKPVMRDGIPVYRYKIGEASNLHLLVDGFKQQGYRWVSIYDVVPFSPAHRVTVPAGTKPSDLLLGDVCGYGHADVVLREKDQIEVNKGNYKWPRNRSQEPSQVWLRQGFSPEEQLLLADINGDQKQDLVVYNRKTGAVQVFYSNGKEFGPSIPFGELPSGLDSLQPFHMNDDKVQLIGRSSNELILAANDGHKFTWTKLQLQIPADATMLVGDITGDRQDDIVCYSPNEKTIRTYPNSGNGEFRAPVSNNIPSTNKKVQVLIGDTNGDGKSDITVYDPDKGLWQVLQGNNDFTLHPIDNNFGPWADGQRVGFMADFDGNGKSDIASYDETGHVLDLALSFRNNPR